MANYLSDPLPTTPVRSSQEQSVQTEPELGNFCDNCASDRAGHTYYNFNKEEENFIYPELQYEVSREHWLYWWSLVCFNMNLTYNIPFMSVSCLSLLHKFF